MGIRSRTAVDRILNAQDRSRAEKALQKVADDILSGLAKDKGIWEEVEVAINDEGDWEGENYFDYRFYISDKKKGMPQWNSTYESTGIGFIYLDSPSKLIQKRWKSFVEECKNLGYSKVSARGEIGFMVKKGSVKAELHLWPDGLDEAGKSVRFNPVGVTKKFNL